MRRYVVEAKYTARDGHVNDISGIFLADSESEAIDMAKTYSRREGKEVYCLSAEEDWSYNSDKKESAMDFRNLTLDEKKELYEKLGEEIRHDNLKNEPLTDEERNLLFSDIHICTFGSNKNLIEFGHKIETIKQVRDRLGCKLRTAKWIVDTAISCVMGFTNEFYTNTCLK